MGVKARQSCRCVLSLCSAISVPENVRVRWWCGSPRGGGGWGTVTWQRPPGGGGGPSSLTWACGSWKHRTLCEVRRCGGLSPLHLPPFPVLCWSLCWAPCYPFAFTALQQSPPPPPFVQRCAAAGGSWVNAFRGCYWVGPNTALQNFRTTLGGFGTRHQYHSVPLGGGGGGARALAAAADRKQRPGALCEGKNG